MVSPVSSEVIDGESHEEPVDDIVHHLRRIPCFFPLAEATLLDIATNSVTKAVVADDIVFSAGQYEAEDIFFCLQGEGYMTGVDSERGSISRTSVRAGDIIGLDCVLAGHTDLVSGISLQASTAMKFLLVDSDTIRKAVASDHQVAMVMMREMARRLVGQALPEGDSDSSSSARIASALCDMARREEGADMWRIEPMPRHRELGELAGATEKQAAEAVAKFIGMQILKRDYPGMMITDYPALMNFSS